MDDRSSFRKKWLYIVVWLLILVISYLIITSRIEGFWSNPWNILMDVGVFIFFLLVWMAFFSQFVLPVRTFGDRQKIFDRLFRHLLGSHGPALFIQNGEIKEHSGETLKKGPGVVWLDSASGALTRTATAIKKTLGPGVHFTDSNEFIEKSGTLDLHIQSQKLGPKDGEKPFDGKKDDQSKEQYDDIQNRRKQVSALSRDGIELVPDISVSFRVNTGFPSTNEPGSRFGYRTGTTREAKELERQDREIISRALLGEGVNPYIDPESALHRAAWNQLPAMMAVDIWRDYAAKFTLDEFFNFSQESSASPSSSPPQQSGDEDNQGNRQPSSPQAVNEGFTVRMIHGLSNTMERLTNTLEKRSAPPPPTAPPPLLPGSASPSGTVNGASKKTALQVINEMVKARLTQQFVDELDEYGRRTGRQIPSEEFKLLQIRGLIVLSASVSNVRVHPSIQEAMIKAWTANWLKLAKDEGEQLDLKVNLIQTAAQERAQCEYAKLISREIYSNCQKGNRSVEGLLLSTLLRSRALIRSGGYSNSLRLRLMTELQDIEDMIKWMGDNE